MLRWGRAKYSGICYVRFFPPLGSHSWVKWRRFLSSCTFSHFSGPSIMHLWIKIGGTLEDLLKWACMIFEHTTTRRHVLLHSKKETHLRHLPSMTHTHTNVYPSTGRTLTPSVHSLQSGIFSPGPLLLRAPWQRGGSSRVSPPGKLWVAGQSLDGGHYGGMGGGETDIVKGEGYTAEMPADNAGKWNNYKCHPVATRSVSIWCVSANTAELL